MESQLAGQRAQCLDSSNKSKTEKPIFKISGSDKENTTTITVDSKKGISVTAEDFQTAEDQSKYKAVKAVVYKIVRVYESRPPNTMKYLGIISVLLLFVGVLTIAFAEEDKAQSKYGLAFTLGESAASTSTSEKIVAPPPPPPAAAAVIAEESNATSSNEEVVNTSTPKQDDIAAPEVNTGVENTVNVTVEDKNENQSEDNSNRPSMVIENDDEEKNDEDPNPRIVFIERLMGLHLSAPVNKDGQAGEQKDNTNEQAPNILKNEKVNAKWASRTRKFTIPIPNQGEPQGIVPPQPAPEHPMLRFAAAAMMSRLIAAAARAQMEAQAREAINARSKDDENEENALPMIIAALNGHGGARPPMQSYPHMYGRPIVRPQVVRPSAAYQPPPPPPQQPRQLPSMIHPSIVAPMQQPNIVLQRRIAPAPQPVVVMLALPLRGAESQQQTQYIQRPQMPFYPTVPYSVPVMYRQQVPAASFAMPIHVQQPAYAHNIAQSRHILAVPVGTHMHYPIQQHIAVRPQVVANAVPHMHDHQTASSEPGHMVLFYDAEVHNEDADDLEPSASEDREEPYHNEPKRVHYLAQHLPPNPTPVKIKLWREMMTAKQAAQAGVRYIPVSMASASHETQETVAVNHFIPQKHFAYQKPQESSVRPTFVMLANHQSE